MRGWWDEDEEWWQRSQFCGLTGTKVSHCRYEHMIVFKEKCVVFFSFFRAEASGNYRYHQPIHAHNYLRSTRKWRMLQVVRVEQVIKFAKLWMLQWVLNLTCGSVLVSPRQEMQRTNKKHCTTTTKTHLPHFFAHIVSEYNCIQSLFNKCQPHIFPDFYFSSFLNITINIITLWRFWNRYIPSW